MQFKKKNYVYTWFLDLTFIIILLIFFFSFFFSFFPTTHVHHPFFFIFFTTHVHHLFTSLSYLLLPHQKYTSPLDVLYFPLWTGAWVSVSPKWKNAVLLQSIWPSKNIIRSVNCKGYWAKAKGVPVVSDFLSMRC